MATRDEFIPFGVTHPGVLIGSELKERGIKQKTFAKEIGMQPTHLNALIRGKMDISEKIAIKLEKGLGVSAIELLSMQNRYSYYKRAIEERGEREAIASQRESELDLTLNLKYVYDFFGIKSSSAAERLEKLRIVGNPEEAVKMEISCCGYFKKSDKCQVDERNMRTWLFIAKCKAVSVAKEEQNVEASPEEAAVTIATFANKGELTVDKIKDTLRNCGIIYIHIPKLDKTPVDAFSTLVCGRYAVIVTYRYNDMDKLAFDILHEIGHIRLHLKEEGQSFISSDMADEKGIYEEEADNYAREHLIPHKIWDSILSSEAERLTPYAVVRRIAENSKSYGVSPTIAVARYKHETNKYDFRGYRPPKIS